MVSPYRSVWVVPESPCLWLGKWQNNAAAPTSLPDCLTNLTPFFTALSVTLTFDLSGLYWQCQRTARTGTHRSILIGFSVLSVGIREPLKGQAGAFKQHGPSGRREHGLWVIPKSVWFSVCHSNILVCFSKGSVPTQWQCNARWCSIIITKIELCLGKQHSLSLSFLFFFKIWRLKLFALESHSLRRINYCYRRSTPKYS